jgi:hypothetical protein
MVAGNRIECSDFRLRVGEQSGSSVLTRGHASRSFAGSRDALSNGPCASRDAVEASRRGCLLRGGVGLRSRCPVEPASCESERSRGTSSAIFCSCCVYTLVFRSF